MTIPSAIAPPQNAQLLLIAHARGFQIYVCRPEGWVLKAPEAVLYDQQGSAIGKHFGGPTWQHNDGSQIAGKLAAKVESPDPAAIPWLLLDVTAHQPGSPDRAAFAGPIRSAFFAEGMGERAGVEGDGIFSRVTSIQRINTVGGLPPASACSESNRDAEHKSPYSADYYFYGPKQP